MKNNKILITIGVLIVAVMFMQGTREGEKMAGGECYQEFANVATACGGLGTGSYSFEGSWTNGGNVYDGDWGTSATGVTAYSSWYYADYTIPSGTTDVKSLVKSGNYYELQCSHTPGSWTTYKSTHTGTADFTIPPACWNGKTVLQLRFTPSSGNQLFYEEAIWWDIGGTSCNGDADRDCDGTIVLQEILNAIANVYGDTTYFSQGTFTSGNIATIITGYYGAIIS